MKKLLLIITFILSLFIFTSCIFGHKETGEYVEVPYEVKDGITKLKLHDLGVRTNNISSFGVMVKLHKSDEKKIIMGYQESMKEEIEFKYESDKLIISSSAITVYFSDFEFNIDIYGYEFNEIEADDAATIYAEEGTLLDNLTVTLYGASAIDIREFNGKKLTFNFEGASEGYITKLKCDDANINIEDAGRLFIASAIVTNMVILGEDATSYMVNGTAKNLDLKLYSASSLNTVDGFTVDDAKIELKKASSANFRANNKVEGKITDASTLTVSGNASVDVEASGASKINRR